MARPRRIITAAAEATTTPPAALSATQTIGRILKAEGNSLYACALPDSPTHILAELSARFRHTIWLRRGGYVLIEMKEARLRQNKIDGEIINVVRDERTWRKQAYWPDNFKNATAYPRDSDDEESHVGKMPPSDSESE